MSDEQTTGTRTPDEVRADIDELRSEIGDTVGELADRADMPARVRATRDAAAARVQEQAARTRALVHDGSAKAQELVAEKAPALDKAVREQPVFAAGVAALIAFLLVGRRIRSRRRRRAAEG